MDPSQLNWIAGYIWGIADDVLTSTLLAARCPVLVAPAMNVNMWEHPAVSRNLATCRELGYEIVEPDEGWLACRWEGPGRLADPERIAARVSEVLAAK